MAATDQTFAELGAALGMSPAGLHVSDPAITGRLTRPRWSPSSVSSIAGCPARWAIERTLPAAPDPFGAAERGTSGHRVLELLYGLPAPERTQDAARSILERLHSDPDVDAPAAMVDLPRWREEVWGAISGLWDIEDPTRVQVLGLERKLDAASIGGVPFVGIIDRTRQIVDENGCAAGVSVDDYKTAAKGGKSPYQRRLHGDSHGDQGKLYKLALESLGEDVEEISIVYTASGVASVYRVPITKPSLRAVRDRFVRTYEQHLEFADAGVYPTVPSGLCGWCPLATVCPAAAEAGKAEPKVTAARAGELLGLGDGGTPHEDSSTASTKEAPMPQFPIFSALDVKPWNGDSQDGRLIGASASAMAVFGFTGWAMEVLHAGNVKLTRSGIEGVAHLLADVCQDAMLQLSGTSDTQENFHTRLRGLLHSVIEIEPIPFGASQEDLIAWRDGAVRRVVTASLIATDLWAEGPQRAKWLALGTADAAAA